MSRVIDINADLGEGGAFDRELLQLISSANISCGAHAGDEHSIQQAIEWALENSVTIGAHPSYPDRENWGRRTLILPPDQLYNSILSQLQSLQKRVRAAGGQLRHVKPHGALYNDAAHNAELAELLAECVRDFDASLTLTGLAGGRLLDAGRRAGLQVCAEAFVDRCYQSDGSLVPRTHAQALITDTGQALAQALALVSGDTITAVDGSAVSITADSLCIHGDSAHALEFARALVSELRVRGVTVQSRFAENPA